jgi:hypothetical protein
MKPVLIIALLAAAIGAGHLWIIALYYELPAFVPLIGAVGTVTFGILAALAADGDTSDA